MLLHRIHLLPACLPALQHSSGRWKCLCLLAPVPSRSLLPRHRVVEKSRQLHCHSAGSLPCTYPCMNGITWHSADPCAWNKGTWKREGIHAEKSALNCCINGHSRVQTPVWQKSAHSLEQMCNSMCTLTLRLAAPINIRCYFCFSLYSSYTKTQWHTGTFIRWQNTMTHTHTHTQSTLCTLPMLVFPCLQMERGSRSSFSNLLFLSPLRFRLALWGSVDVVLGLTSSAQAIDKLCF